ncbi:hypothetical protein EPA93_17505 [Ktedonosporobacter rubrisoli]|uniref:Uncharacterized protein n=1 Tax=Ktedonosporobacter rubrisoli TaxID=2509675 RepID=A0A4P6JQJ2_KTERU|nr:hypothetical protein [Ktedonosporobacter rubrisoli]QBD77689.1 hypothetical protein EPA93_17505 [Ktedonosporobacter rubrisoli]
MVIAPGIIRIVIFCYYMCIASAISTTPNMLLGRGMMGDGVIKLRRLRLAVEETGYTRPIEFEIFHQQLREMPGPDLLYQMGQRYLEHV